MPPSSEDNIPINVSLDIATYRFPHEKVERHTTGLVCSFHGVIFSICGIFIIPQNSFSVNIELRRKTYLSSRNPFYTGRRIPPFSVSRMKCAVPTSSGFNQTTFLYFSNHGFLIVFFFENFKMNTRSSLLTPR